MALYSAAKHDESDLNDVIFVIADQMNYGIDELKSPDLRHELAKLNEMAGNKAVGHSAYDASHSYFKIALSLFQTNHWESEYDGSLRLSLLLANSAYSCGDVEESRNTLQHIFDHATCLDDKLDAYHLLIQLLGIRGVKEEYLDGCKIAHEVLAQLGEEIPESISAEETVQLFKMTSTMLKNASVQSLLESGKDVERNIEFILEFYDSMYVAAFHVKQQYVPFIACRMVQLSMEHGSTKHLISGKFDVCEGVHYVHN